MKSLFTAYKVDECCHFVVSIGSPTLISLYCMCIVFFCFPLFTYFFVESATCSEIEVSFINYKKVVELFLDSK